MRSTSISAILLVTILQASFAASSARAPRGRAHAPALPASVQRAPAVRAEALGVELPVSLFVSEAQLHSAPEASEHAGAFDAARELAGSLEPESGAGDSDAKAALDRGFDKGAGPAGDAVASDGRPLSELYAPVIILQDVFAKPVAKDDALVRYVEKYRDMGGHLVFMTWRPHKGPGSAEQFLLKQLKPRPSRPILVVSENGGRIALHGRAAEPKPVLRQDEKTPPQGFSRDELKGFRALQAPLAKALKTRGLQDKALEFSYTVTVPARKDAAALRDRMIAYYNKVLERRKSAYRMAPHPDDARSGVIFALPLRLSLRRTMDALDTAFKGEGLLEKSRDFLFLIDAKKHPKLATSDFARRSEIQHVTSQQDVEALFGAFLSDRRYPVVKVKLSMLRSFLYWDARRQSKALGRPIAAPGASYAPKMGGVDKLYSSYAGILLKAVMYNLFWSVWNHDEAATKADYLRAELKSMWLAPWKHGIRVSKAVMSAMGTKAWRSKRFWDSLEKAQRQLERLRERWVNDLKGAARIINGFVPLDRMDYQTKLPNVSPETGKVYEVYTSIDRLMYKDVLEDGREVRHLTVVATRTGMEPSPNSHHPAEEMTRRVLAHAALQGHLVKGQDGEWHHGNPEGPIVTRVQVLLDFMSVPQDAGFKPSDFMYLAKSGNAYVPMQGPLVREQIGVITRALSNAEFLEYWKEYEEMVDAGKPGRKASGKKDRKGKK